ncbi:bifunctional DNA primase/polymerase [Actinoplanes regularis]|uniref:bifunctional DNA primase/polymerase n=1 Tax=Actinoplanes regularis TaxID=52697 RepID=UPI0032DA7B1E
MLVTESYPHVCRRLIPAEDTVSRTRPIRLIPRDCAACAIQRGSAARRDPLPVPLTLETTMPEPAPTLPAALALAAEGYPVFLLGRSKRPVANCPQCPKAGERKRSHDPEACDHLTCHGFYAATRDPDRITAMHTAVPGGLLAIRTGRVCDLAVVDIDPRNGGAIDRDLMPATRAVRTGSGGWHLYYRHPGCTLAAKLRDHPGVDLKADGGYVVAPPSIHPSTGQPYRRIGDRAVIEMPRALVELSRPVEPAPTATPTGTVTPLHGGEGISDPAALLAANLQAVADAPEGTRRNTLYGAARGVARMVAAGALTADDAHAALYQAGRAAGQTDRDTRAAISGGFRAEGVALLAVAA